MIPNIVYAIKTKNIPTTAESIAKSPRLINFLEECDDSFTCLEMKFNPKKANIKIPNSFAESYNVRSFNVVTSENYLDFVM